MCHTTSGWPGATTDHGTLSNGFDLLGNHGLLPCTGCHVPGGTETIFTPSAPDDCLACHQMPIPEAPFHGDVGPPLHGIGGRYSAAQIRLRIVDERQVNPATIMPGFYRDPALANRVADAYWGKTFLSAQQVEDLVARGDVWPLVTDIRPMADAEALHQSVENGEITGRAAIMIE